MQGRRAPIIDFPLPVGSARIWTREKFPKVSKESKIPVGAAAPSKVGAARVGVCANTPHPSKTQQEVKMDAVDVLLLQYHPTKTFSSKLAL